MFKSRVSTYSTTKANRIAKIVKNRDIAQGWKKYRKFAQSLNLTGMKYRDYRSEKRVVEVHDLSFLSDRNHHYGWFRRHYRHHKLRRALRKAKAIIASDPVVARDLTRYYFIPKDRITLK